MSRGSVLVVDDRLSEIKYHLLSLEREGYELTTASTTEKALEEIAAHHFNVAIIDVVMPFEMDAGVRLALEIRKRSSNCRILVFTAYLQEEVFDWFEGDPKVRLLMKRETSPLLLVEEVNALMDDRKRPPKAFIVHGRDKTAWLELKNYLQSRLKLPEPVILTEQSSSSHTIIEKFEKYAEHIDVAFVIMTPDDSGRARQNVIFETGYFMGMLGRKSGRVVILHRGPWEIPSDLAGVGYIDISNGIEPAGEDIRRELSPWL